MNYCEKENKTEMQALERLLGKNVVWLICRQLHAMYTRQLVAEYHRRLGNIHGVHSVQFDWAPGRKLYNFRTKHIYGKNIRNKHCEIVGEVPKNY